MEELAAVIISQISPQGELEDKVLQDSDAAHKVAYICTLGTWPKFRKHRLAAQLLQALIARVESEEAVKAISLHVLTTNEVAVNFYEKNGFCRITTLKGFYTIDGQSCDAYLYARYFHGGVVPMSAGMRILLAVHRPLISLCKLLCEAGAVIRRRWGWRRGCGACGACGVCSDAADARDHFS